MLDSAQVCQTYSFIRTSHTSCIGFSRKTKRRSSNLTFRNIDDILSLNNYKLGNFVDHIYRTELEIKDTPDIDKFA